MAGFRPPKYRLTFDVAPYEGLEVMLRGLSMNEALRMYELLPKATAGEASASLDLIGMFVDVITGWNVEDDDGNPVPVTRDNVLAQDFPMLMAIVNRYQAEVSGAVKVPPPLPGASGGTPVTPASLQIPMETTTPPGS